jgi:SAM-dependent methyltransferase
MTLEESGLSFSCTRSTPRPVRRGKYRRITCACAKRDEKTGTQVRLWFGIGRSSLARFLTTTLVRSVSLSSMSRRGESSRKSVSSMRWLTYILRRGKREGRDMVLRRGMSDRKTIREDVALRFLRGEGVEIGALDFPLRLPRGARVRYVDYLNAAGLREAYDGTLREGRPLVVPDVVDDGARLASFADASLDFVVANHMLEHVEDPIAALQHQLRVLRPGGVLYMTLPDARQSFDAPRERTTPEHLLRDHREGPQVSRREHYEECARHIEGHNGQVLTQRVDEMEAECLRPHFHVWEPVTFAEFLAALDLPCSLELLQASVGEFLVVLRKR